MFEDIHWAEPTLLDLVDHIAEWSRDAPILLLCLARPELLDNRPNWGGGKLNSTSLMLEALTDGEAGALIDHLVGDRELAPELRRRIAEEGGGNPLFVEQMLALVAERPGTDVEVPPTIQALIAARLDGLTDAERTVIERAALMGTRFWQGALSISFPQRRERHCRACSKSLYGRNSFAMIRRRSPGQPGIASPHPHPGHRVRRDPEECPGRVA